jgi:hypothetical protein
LGDWILQVEIEQWFVKEGDQVQEFQKLCEVRSDKANVEITSRFEFFSKQFHAFVFRSLFNLLLTFKEKLLGLVGLPLILSPFIGTDMPHTHTHTHTHRYTGRILKLHYPVGATAPVGKALVTFDSSDPIDGHDGYDDAQSATATNTNPSIASTSSNPSDATGGQWCLSSFFACKVIVLKKWVM